MLKETHTVTGAFGYSGKYIARKLISRGRNVVTLTNSPQRANAFAGQVKALPFNFDNPKMLEESLRGVTTLYNTYWVRFNHKTFTFADAVRNTEILFEAAKNADVRRIVHVSITNPSLDSPYEYFSGKARLEQALINSRVSYAILRPAVLFGAEDVLINNIAWSLRRLPVFGVFGDGAYKIQPIYVEDLAELAVNCGEQRDNVIINAIGPETYTYRELAKTVGEIIGKRRTIISVPPAIGYLTSLAIGLLVNDVLVTKDEIHGLMDNLLYVDAPPAGATKLSEWASAHKDALGLRYANELARRTNRSVEYFGA